MQVDRPGGIAPELAALGAERRQGRKDARDVELERLKKIEANYEKDKAMLAKQKAPALARSESHDVGHAEGSGGITKQLDTPVNVGKKLLSEFLDEARKRVIR
jgi:hypothetical protein